MLNLAVDLAAPLAFGGVILAWTLLLRQYLRAARRLEASIRARDRLILDRRLRSPPRSRARSRLALRVVRR